MPTTYDELVQMHENAERDANYYDRPVVIVEAVDVEHDERETHTVWATHTVYIPQSGAVACGTDYAGACAALREYDFTPDYAAWQYETIHC